MPALCRSTGYIDHTAAVNRSLFKREVLPFYRLFLYLLLMTAAGDLLLHLGGRAWVGRYLGILGTLTILLAFAYSLRKRDRIRRGNPLMLLRLHEFLTWLGAVMILIHAGVHFNAILPWLATLVMLVNVISGLTGKFLLERSQNYLHAKRAHFSRAGLDEQALERALFWDCVTLDVMQRWRAIHFPITLAFAVLALAHILSILLFWNWR